MPQTIRFHLDENANNAIADGLRRRRIDVTTTTQSGLISASDEDQLRFARSQGRVIFTQDSDFLKLHNAGVEHCGIVYCVMVSSNNSAMRSLLCHFAYFAFYFTVLFDVRVGIDRKCS